MGTRSVLDVYVPVEDGLLYPRDVRRDQGTGGTLDVRVGGGRQSSIGVSHDRFDGGGTHWTLFMME